MKRNLLLGLSLLAALLATLVLAAPAPAALKITSFGGSLSAPDGGKLFQAGAHADLTTRIQFATKTTEELGFPQEIAAESPRNVEVDLPPGLIGTPAALPVCTESQLTGGDQGISAICPAVSQVGWIEPFGVFGSQGQNPLFNMEPAVGTPAIFAANILGTIVRIVPRVSANGEYKITADSIDSSQGINLSAVNVKFWGVPADPAHDSERSEGSVAGLTPRLPLMSNPTSCPIAPLAFSVRADSWDVPGVLDHASFDTDLNGESIEIDGCGQLDFRPSVEARPTTSLADSPSGLDVRISIPQSEDPDGLATAHLRDVSIELPAGMTVNPASAQGLGACTPAQVGLVSPIGQGAARFDEAPVNCPDAAKLGTVEVDTPATVDPLQGAIYLATQDENPFGSLLAVYIVIEDARTGITIKLAGQPVPDSGTGQLRFDFERNPQLPFDDFEVNLFTGPRAALKTPMACGQFTATSTMVPWSSPEGATANPSDSFAIVGGPNGAPCLESEATAPNRPSFNAGTADPTAGAYTPFTLRVAREDGTQPLTAIETTLPKGLLGKLAGIPYCPDAALASAAGRSGKEEQASPSCPAGSRVGSVTVGAGAGSTPVYVGGKAYLAGPYKGAPLSLAVVTPAVAGPFDLGTVVIRNALQINPETTQIRAVSDTIPTILQGIPLDIRSIVVEMDRPEFILNPTNCAPTSVLGGATPLVGSAAALSSRFQVGGCRGLGFKPKLGLRFSGPTHRSAYPRLRATLTMPGGNANIAKAQVTLPRTTILEQAHIKTICTRVQYAAKACPAQSIYGYAKAWSPLIEKPLEGPVYLRSSSNTLPDLVASLDGQIHVDLVGRIDSPNARLRNTFDLVPDAPVSKFVLTMQGGKKGLLVNNTELCKAKPRADVKFDGQNGRTADSRPLVKADCKGKKAKKRKGPARKRGSRR